MTKAELEDLIEELEEALEGLPALQRTLNQSKINQLKMEIEGMALSDITAKLSEITLPDTEEIRANIQAAADATKAHNQRVEAFNTVYEFIKGRLGL